MNTLFTWLWLAPALPLLASLIIAAGFIHGTNRGEAGERLTSGLSLAAIGASLMLLLLADLAAMVTGAPGTIALGEWFTAGKVVVGLELLADPLGLGMATLVALVSLLVTRFSINYLHREAGFQRFFLVLNLFNGAMLLIVLAGNALLTFVGWELAGVSSYLLIGYSWQRPQAVANATRAFVTNRIGDAGFLLALFLSLYWSDGLAWSQLLDTSGLSSLTIGLLALGFLIAALAKSAQVPFAPWIARALEGPTPSSAIFYGSLMVHAGVYLLIRISPLLEQAPALQVLLALLGLLTAAYGLLGALVQNDAKSALMFSTTGQVGLMFLWCGLGWFELATWHLVGHALWRAFHFLHAPALMHLMTGPARPIPAWLARNQRLYTALLERFWLDHLADWLVVNPSKALAQEVRRLDEQVVEPAFGLPKEFVTQESTLGSRCSEGILGRLLQSMANLLHWFEERLVLRSGGEGLLQLIQRVGRHAVKVEELLAQPRYLWLMIIATFVVVI